MTLASLSGSRGDGAPLRARVIAGVLALLFVVIVGRAGQIALAGGEAGPAPGSPAASARRADIVDRKGDLIATSLPSWSLAADPRAIWDPEETAAAIASVLPGVDQAALAASLSNRERRFVWIERAMTPRQRQAVFDLGLEGLRFEEEMRRVYPAGSLAGHLIGFTSVDGRGLDGMERAFEDRLAAGGEPLRLTLDAGVQFALEAELEAAARDFEMIGAAGVVLDAHDGAVRALASWPAVDPNHPQAAPGDARLNRALGAVYELGSVYKPLTVAAALDAEVIDPLETFDISQPLRLGSAAIRDSHPMPNAGAASVTDILAESSNIGAALIAQRLGPERQKAFLAKVGLLGRPEYEGPPSAAPLTPAEWDELTSATVSYGHGVAVSPLAFALAMAPLANGGYRVAPRFIETDEPQALGTRVLSTRTASEVLAMMRQVVLRGTGRNAEAPGYEVAGKTGTAEKPGPDGYDPDRNVTSFAAVFPASRPQFVVLVVLDEARPRSGDPRTAAYTSATIAGRLIARAAPLLGVDPRSGGVGVEPVRAEDTDATPGAEARTL